MQFANAGFRVLAIDLRGYGLSKNGPAHLNPDGFGSPLDVLAAVRYLRDAGATSVSDHRREHGRRCCRGRLNPGAAE